MKKYCENCQKETQVKFEKIKEVFNVKGESIEAEITICKCMDCGEEVFDEAIEKENEKIVFGLYREKKGLLQPDEIKAIREKYGLSQAGFAKLLGFGEKTITRYENGSIQDVAHDNLIRLISNKETFIGLWERCKEVLSERENASVEKALRETPKDIEKCIEIIQDEQIIKQYLYQNCKYSFTRQKILFDVGEEVLCRI